MTMTGLPLRELFRRLPDADSPAGPAVVRPAVQIERVIDQHALLPEQPYARLLQKGIHPGVAGLFPAAGKGEAGQDFFFDVMVAITGVDAVPALYPAQDFRQKFRVFQGLIFIVENIPRYNYNICVFLIDKVHHLFQIGRAHV